MPGVAAKVRAGVMTLVLLIVVDLTVVLILLFRLWGVFFLITIDELLLAAKTTSAENVT